MTIAHVSSILAQRKPRSAMVLVVVLVVITMLSLAGFSFAEWMLTERQAADLMGQEIQARAAAESGVEYLQAVLDHRNDFAQESSSSQSNTQSTTNNLSDDPERFCGVPVVEGAGPGRWPRFSIVSSGMPSSSSGPSASGSSIRFGIENESAKLNLAAVLAWENAQPGHGRDALLKLPGMTMEIADAILDWIDADDTQREFGAETSYYAGLSPPREPANAMPRSLDELLLVRGVTRELLWGRDTNRNGMLESRELSATMGEESASSNQNGMNSTLETTPPQGWSSLLTLASGVANRDRTGRPRVNVNDANLAQLHARLSQELDKTWADFIVAYRQFGPQAASTSPTPTASENLTLDLKQPAKVQIGSLFDLVDSQVVVLNPTKVTASLVASPVRSNQDRYSEQLDKLLDRLTTTAAPIIGGQINIDLAPPEVLRGVPGLTEERLTAILDKRGSEAEAAASPQRNLGWLLVDNVLPLAELKAVAPYLTTGGDIFHAQVVGFFSTSESVAGKRVMSHPSCRLEVVVDATLRPSRLLSWNDLAALGKGYPPSLLDRQDGASLVP